MEMHSIEVGRTREPSHPGGRDTFTTRQDVPPGEEGVTGDVVVIADVIQPEDEGAGTTDYDVHLNLEDGSRRVHQVGVEHMESVGEAAGVIRNRHRQEGTSSSSLDTSSVDEGDDKDKKNVRCKCTVSGTFRGIATFLGIIPYVNGISSSIWMNLIRQSVNRVSQELREAVEGSTGVLSENNWDVLNKARFDLNLIVLSSTGGFILAEVIFSPGTLESMLKPLLSQNQTSVDTGNVDCQQDPWNPACPVDCNVLPSRPECTGGGGPLPGTSSPAQTPAPGATSSPVNPCDSDPFAEGCPCSINPLEAGCPIRCDLTPLRLECMQTSPPGASPGNPCDTDPFAGGCTCQINPMDPICPIRCDLTPLRPECAGASSPGAVPGETSGPGGVEETLAPPGLPVETSSPPGAVPGETSGSGGVEETSPPPAAVAAGRQVVGGLSRRHILQLEATPEAVVQETPGPASGKNATMQVAILGASQGAYKFAANPYAFTAMLINALAAMLWEGVEGQIFIATHKTRDFPKATIPRVQRVAFWISKVSLYSIPVGGIFSYMNCKKTRREWVKDRSTNPETYHDRPLSGKVKIKLIKDQTTDNTLLFLGLMFQAIVMFLYSEGKPPSFLIGGALCAYAISILSGNSRNAREVRRIYAREHDHVPTDIPDRVV